MGFWFWFSIWTALGLGSVVAFAFIAKSLFNRLGDVVHQVNRLAKPIQKLAESLATRSAIEQNESALLDPLNDLIAERAKYLKGKSKKRAARQRRLISALKNIDVNESGFTNV